MSRRSITGGTMDLKPQMLSLKTLLSEATNIVSVIKIPLPIPRFGTQRKRATIFEVLKVFFYPGMEQQLDPGFQLIGGLSTSEVLEDLSGGSFVIAANYMASPNVFAGFSLVETLTTTGSSGYTLPIVMDLTDGAGNGFLVATDSLVLTYIPLNFIINSSLSCKILYRMVNVGIEEYVGIVQSQISN